MLIAAVNVWLLKTEPSECGIDDIRAAPAGVMRWDGIRNYQARNLLRDALRDGDLCLIYHSGVREPALAGSAVVTGAPYPDPAQFDPSSPLHDPASSPDKPRWFCVDIRYRMHFPRTVTLAAIKAEPALRSMVLLRQGRLSVQAVSAAEWTLIAAMAGVDAG